MVNFYNFDNIRVISAGVRDADAEGVEGMSASKMRKGSCWMMTLIHSVEELQKNLMMVILRTV